MSEFLGINLARGFYPVRGLFDALEGRAYIAGGYARWAASERSEPLPGDIDVFPLTYDDFIFITNRLGQAISPVRRSLYAVTYQTPESMIQAGAPDTIQVVRPAKDYASIEEILSRFDLTICAAAIIDQYQVLVHEYFEEDDRNRRLTLLNVTNPLYTMKRAIKYATGGFEFGFAELQKLFVAWEKISPEIRQQVSDAFEQPMVDASYILGEEGREQLVERINEAAQRIVEQRMGAQV